MAYPLLRIWKIDAQITWLSAIVVVCHGFMIIRDLTQGRYTHCKALHGKQLFDGGYEIHAVTENRKDASRAGAVIVLHVNDKKRWFESHDEEMWFVKVEML